MVHGIDCHHDIADIDARIKRSADAGVHDGRCAEAVYERVGAKGGIHHAHAAFHDGNGMIAEAAGREGHSGLRFLGDVARLPHEALQRVDFDVHGPYDADMRVFIESHPISFQIVDLISSVCLYLETVFVNVARAAQRDESCVARFSVGRVG